MEHYQLKYDPKEKRIEFVHVSRPAGYQGKKIHMHDHHELVFVTSLSQCLLVNNGNTATITTPAVFLHRAGTFHEVVSVESGQYDSHVAFFSPGLLQDIPAHMQFSELLFSSDMLVIPLSQEQLAQAFCLFEMMEYRTGPQQLPLLLTIFAQLAEFARNNAQAIRVHAAKDYIFSVIELLQAVGSQWDLETIAKHFHVSKTKLKTDFRRITGMSVIAYRNLCRLDKSRLLLSQTDLRQAQIAEKCGFSEESYFIRAFKKQYGITPAIYRKGKVN